MSSFTVGLFATSESSVEKRSDVGGCFIVVTAGRFPTLGIHISEPILTRIRLSHVLGAVVQSNVVIDQNGEVHVGSPSTKESRIVGGQPAIVAGKISFQFSAAIVAVFFVASLCKHLLDHINPKRSIDIIGYLEPTCTIS